MKIDQIAFGCWNKLDWDEFAREAEVVDTVTFSGMHKSRYGITKFENKTGDLAFDYRGGIEREYLHYPNPMDTFHDLITDRSKIFLSHLASHVPDMELALDEIGRSTVVMDVTTTHHTNEKLRELGRKYRYAILDWRQTHGYFYKLIQRIERVAIPTQGS